MAHIAFIGRMSQFVAVLMVIGLIVISIANVASGNPLVPWPFYAFALLLCGCLWMAGRYLAEGRSD
jgi:hypothetical protein